MIGRIELFTVSNARLEKVTEINLIAFTRNENIDSSKDTFYKHNHNEISENVKKRREEVNFNCLYMNYFSRMHLKRCCVLNFELETYKLLLNNFLFSKI